MIKRMMAKRNTEGPPPGDIAPALPIKVLTPDDKIFAAVRFGTQSAITWQYAFSDREVGVLRREILTNAVDNVKTFTSLSQSLAIAVEQVKTQRPSFVPQIETIAKNLRRDDVVYWELVLERQKVEEIATDSDWLNILTMNQSDRLIFLTTKRLRYYHHNFPSMKTRITANIIEALPWNWVSTILFEMRVIDEMWYQTNIFTQTLPANSGSLLPFVDWSSPTRFNYFLRRVVLFTIFKSAQILSMFVGTPHAVQQGLVPDIVTLYLNAIIKAYLLFDSVEVVFESFAKSVFWKVVNLVFAIGITVVKFAASYFPRPAGPIQKPTVDTGAPPTGLDK